MKLAVDIGCGTGQSTRPLAPYFENVLGFDISEAQVENAKKEDTPENVEYRYVHLSAQSRSQLAKMKKYIPHMSLQ